ncbi:MAG: cell envelope integrity protein CreD, partial [Treponema sp.]|nr:cell envelope integrity protein CreD [Treponema sp.]
MPCLPAGIGNAIFYLLLLSLSGQMSFFTACLIAALAVTAMMTLYSRSLLSSWNKRQQHLLFSPQRSTKIRDISEKNSTTKSNRTKGSSNQRFVE